MQKQKFLDVIFKIFLWYAKKKILVNSVPPTKKGWEPLIYTDTFFTKLKPYFNVRALIFLKFLWLKNKVNQLR